MSDIRDTYIRAVDLLARREHSRLELRKKLRKKGFEPDQIEQVLDQLIEEGYLSEARFAENYLRSRALRGFGPLKIRVELSERGVSESISTAAFDQLPEEFWRDILESVWDKKFTGRYDGSQSAKAKSVRFLHSRGFPSQDIFQLIDEKVVDEQ